MADGSRFDLDGFDRLFAPDIFRFRICVFDTEGNEFAWVVLEFRPFAELARRVNAELDRLFPKTIQILAEPGRFMVANAAVLVSEIIGKNENNIGFPGLAPLSFCT